MIRLIERAFESALWNSRFVVLIAVFASLASSFAIFFLTAVDVIYVLSHLGEYADAAITKRLELREGMVTHVVEVVDGFLLATVLLIFALGLYEPKNLI